MASLTQQLIRFDTTNPPGDEAACIQMVDQLLRNAGLDPVLDGATPQRPNLVARLAGRGEAPPLLLQGHMDVVTTAGQSWAHPPFGGELVDGEVWGRGAIDMKGGVAMMVSAILRLIADGHTPPGDVVIALLSDEEAGGLQGARWLVVNRSELFSGVRHGLGEGGGFAWHVGGRRFYPVMVAEKRVCITRCTIKGPGGHGSRRLHGGAMAKLGHMLTALDQYRMPVQLGAASRWMVEGLRDGLPAGELRDNVALLFDPSNADSALDRLGDLGLRLDPLLHNSVNATMVTASQKFNVIPTEVVLVLDCRLLPGQPSEAWLRQLGSALGPDGELSVVIEAPVMPEPELGPFFETLCDILREEDPGCMPIPSLMSGATDALWFSQLGIRTYGFLPHNFGEGASYEGLMHSADERVPVSALEFGTAAIQQAVERYRG